MTNECKACKAELSPGVNHYCRGSQRVTREDLEVLTEAVRKLDNRVESHSMSIMYLTQAVKGSGENISNAFVEIHKLADKHDALGHQHIELEIERLKDQLRTIGRAIVDSPTGTIVCKREEPVTREVPAVEQDDVSVTREEFDALESRIRLLEIADAEQGRKNTRFDARLSAIERALPIGVPGELRIRNLRVTPIGEHAAREKNTGAVAQPEEQGGHEPLRDAGSTPAGTNSPDPERGYRLSDGERADLWSVISEWHTADIEEEIDTAAQDVERALESLVTRAVREERERLRSLCDSIGDANANAGGEDYTGAYACAHAIDNGGGDLDGSRSAGHATVPGTSPASALPPLTERPRSLDDSWRGEDFMLIDTAHAALAQGLANTERLYALSLEARLKAAEERLAEAEKREANLEATCKTYYECWSSLSCKLDAANARARGLLADRDALRAQLDRTVPALQAGSRALALDLSEIAKAVGLTDDLAEPPQVIDHVRRVVSDRDALKAQLAGMVTREQALAAMACWATDNEEAREAYWRHDTMDDCLAAVLREKGGAA